MRYMMCSHKWELLSETTTKSKIEHAKDLGASVKTGYTTDLERKFIQVFSCKYCGKLERFVEKL